jgi:hypothetical protein
MHAQAFPLTEKRELHRQGKNLERTTNKRSINVTVNGDSQREQEAASMRTTKKA